MGSLKYGNNRSQESSKKYNKSNSSINSYMYETSSELSRADNSCRAKKMNHNMGISFDKGSPE